MTSLIRAALAAAIALSASSVLAEDSVARGEYLVGVIGCADCHSPRTADGALDMSKAMSGGMGFEIPGLGIFWAPNLTGAETGLRDWSVSDIVTALRTGTRPDGRELAPMMPWRFYAALTDEDADAIAQYIKTLPAIENAVPAPVAPGEKAPAPYLTLAFPPA
ncbi:c-type cytochrome [Oceaniglobus roseus]|uniref:c-type cytochrome n=1 Tax=Oceaniglobus roseus TaxID=1737570 RepID=UPI000C7F3F31|nr:c-type cytochrome [Kandeliimicrobium roseum]